MAEQERTVLTFEGDGGLNLRVIDFGQRGLAFTTEEGSSPRGITLGPVELDALERFIGKWRGRGVA